MEQRCVLFFTTETGATQRYTINKARDNLTATGINNSMNTIVRNNILNGPNGRIVGKQRATYTKTRKWEIPL